MTDNTEDAWKEEVFKCIVHEISICRNCELHKSRTHTVAGEGNLNTKLMLVGEGPGYNEDKQGRPFVGEAGKVLSDLLSTIGLIREDVFITNAVKCRPPGNRTPSISEIMSCKPYLISQIALIEPKFILILGNAALVSLLGGGFSISKVRGRPKEQDGIIYLPTYHPAAALYRREIMDIIKEDFNLLKSLMNGGE
ncbi:MAG TPA: uracil-DNA glycosylase [Caldisericia bacterium]|nr:uracil-DNA glycosylase [Caldisericia bacterium]